MTTSCGVFCLVLLNRIAGGNHRSIITIRSTTSANFPFEFTFGICLRLSSYLIDFDDLWCKPFTLSKQVLGGVFVADESPFNIWRRFRVDSEDELVARLAIVVGLAFLLLNWTRCRCLCCSVWEFSDLVCACFRLRTQSRLYLVALALDRGAVLFSLEFDVGGFHLHYREYLLHLADGGVLLGFGGRFGGLAADWIHLVMGCHWLVLLPHVRNQSRIKVERVVEVLSAHFELEVLLILQVNLRLRVHHPSLSMHELALTLLLLRQVLGHWPNLAPSRGLFAARKGDVLLWEKFVNQLRAVVRTVLLRLIEDSGLNDRHGWILDKTCLGLFIQNQTPTIVLLGILPL